MSTEKKTQKEILKYLTEKGILHYRQNSGAIRTRGHFYKFCSINGISDIVCVYKGRYIGIEVKDVKGKQNKDQLIFEENLKKAGGIYVLARELKDVKKIFENENRN